MSSGSSQRKEPRPPMFQQVQEKALPKPPRPIETKLVDPFEDLPAVGPRSGRRSVPDLRTLEPEPDLTLAPLTPPTAPVEAQASLSGSEPVKQPVAKKAQFPYPEQTEQPPAKPNTNVPQQERSEQPAAKAKATSPQLERSTQPGAKTKTTFLHQERSALPALKVQTAFPQQERFDRAAYNRPTSNRQVIYDEPHQYWDAPIKLARRRPGLLLLLIGIVCGVIVWGWANAGAKTFISTYNGGHMPAASDIAPEIIIPPNTPPGQHSVLGKPSISAAAIDTVLSEYGSPAAGTGQAWVAIGERYGIDPAYALAFFIHESSAGTNPGWAGLKSDGSSTHNVGNIICAGYATCYGRFRDYPSWEEGIDDWYKLIGNEYVNGRSASTVEQIIPIYAPSSDNNDVPAYVQSVVGMVNNWRQGVYR
jgi:hypothetical protein